MIREVISYSDPYQFGATTSPTLFQVVVQFITDAAVLNHSVEVNEMVYVKGFDVIAPLINDLHWYDVLVSIVVGT